MINIALIVPKQNFIEVAFDTFAEHNLENPDYEGDPYIMEEIIVTKENVNKVKINADIIITRGLLAEILKNIQTNIPIIEIPVPVSDVIRTFIECKNKFGNMKVGLIAARNMVSGIESLSPVISIPFNVYELNANWNGPELVNKAIKDGCDIIAGGLNTCNYADLLHINNIPIRTSRESFWQCLTDAKRAITISRIEQEKTKSLEVILNSSSDGIISIDKSKKINIINDSAKKILGITKSLPDNISLSDLPASLEVKKILMDFNEYQNEIIKQKEIMITITKSFIKINNISVGTIITLQDISGIQDLETKIRKKIYTTGHIAKSSFNSIVGTSKNTLEIIERAQKFSQTNSNILLIGESGTGKEIFAQSIHNHSQRKNKPFVAVNCAAIPENLLESELFGYASGAFTGAQKGGKPGLFELAHNGTIFLDEIGEISPSIQAKLLRVLQEREIMRLGDGNVIPVDIRIISATNKDLQTLVKENKFREDLYFRLDVLRLDIPPLNTRREDIPILADKFLNENFPEYFFTDDAKNFLMQYNWYGNIRQLFNYCERIAVLSNSKQIDVDCILSVIPDISKYFNYNPPPISHQNIYYNDEASMIRDTLISVKYNRQKAAAILGMDRSTLWRKIKMYNL